MTCCSRCCKKRLRKKTNENLRLLYVSLHVLVEHYRFVANSSDRQRKTYTSRIEELDQLAYEEFTDDKALPARPRTASYPSSTAPSLQREDELAETSPKRAENIHLSDDRLRTDASQPGPSLDLVAPGGAQSTPSDGFDQESIPVSSSWLDSKADSGGSASSSVHSRTSSLGIRRKQMVRPPSGDTEAEFDAALDAAVEAAYDDGYEPADSDEDHASTVANALMRVELAKERVRQSEREAMELDQGRDVQQNANLYDQPAVPGGFYNDDSSDDEERLLEEMTRGYEIEDFALSQRSTLDQNHDGTWDSSELPSDGNGDNIHDSRNTPSRFSMNSRPVTTSPMQHNTPAYDSDSEGVDRLETEQHPGPGVQSRRASRQNPKQLKIETSRLGPLHYQPIREVDGADYGDVSPGRGTSPDRVPESLQLLSGGSVADVDGHLPEGYSPEEEDDEGLETSGSPLARSLLAKNYSSSSLRSARSRNFSLSHLDDISDLSPGTPSSNPFGSTSRLPMFSPTATPMVSTFDDQLSTDPAESLYLFDGQYASPGSPNLQWEGAPVELEPCPSDFLLRPFWLMRCLYQTIAHPRGGYLSSRLFVPQDVWRVKGVKLRNVEDKVSACDYLTATLLKLGRVDTFDADAVLEEMQGLEGVLDQMTANLSRKLGADVGVQNPGVLFKDSTNGVPDVEPPPANVPRSASVSGKSAAPFSWRRLRAKNSAAGLNASYNGSGNGKGFDSGMDSPGLDSLPMTLQPTSRPPKRAVDRARFTGPHAGYMESLARLFDAAQTVGKYCCSRGLMSQALCRSGCN